MVPWMRGTLKKCFLASSTPLAIAAGTSLALPSPTTTRAVKLKRRPPLTTLATRLIATTRSTNAVFSGAPPPLRSRLSRRLPSLAPAVPPRRWGPGIRRPSSRTGCGWSGSQGQPCLARAVRDGGDPAVVAVAAPVEHHRVDAGVLGPLADELANLARLGGLVPGEAAQVGLHRRG